MALAVNDENFKIEVIDSILPVLVDFWGKNCPPCHMMAPVIEELSAEYEGRVKIVKANVGETAQVAGSLEIMAVPTLILFCNGEVVERHIGFVSKDQIIQNLLSKVIL